MGLGRRALDISVHCDVSIFQWLITYVKVVLQTVAKLPLFPPGPRHPPTLVATHRQANHAAKLEMQQKENLPLSAVDAEFLTAEATSEESRRAPKLTPRNAISVLISSHFLVMPPLVEECLRCVPEEPRALLAGRHTIIKGFLPVQILP